MSDMQSEGMPPIQGVFEVHRSHAERGWRWAAYLPWGGLLALVRLLLLLPLLLLARLLPPVRTLLMPRCLPWLLGFRARLRLPTHDMADDGQASPFPAPITAAAATPSSSPPRPLLAVSNQCSYFDWMAWAMVCPSISLVKTRFPTWLTSPYEVIKSHTAGRSQNHQMAMSSLLKSKECVFAQPEGAPTNGQVALLEFSDKTVTRMGMTVYPVFLEVSRPAYVGAFVTCLGSSYVADLLYCLYSPYTHFDFVLLDPVTPATPAEDITENVRRAIAAYGRLVCTPYTHKHKRLLETRNIEDELEGLTSTAVSPVFDDEVFVDDIENDPTGMLAARTLRSGSSDSESMDIESQCDNSSNSIPATSSSITGLRHRHHTNLVSATTSSHSKAQSSSPRQTTLVPARVLAPEAKDDCELLVQRVLAVLPHANAADVRADLLLTKDVNLTIANVVDGKCAKAPAPRTLQTQTSLPYGVPLPKAADLENARDKWHDAFLTRKQLMIEAGRKKYAEKAH